MNIFKEVNVGTAPDSGDGDINRNAWIKTNENFEKAEELLAAAPRVDEFTYNDETELFENVKNDYQDILADAKACVVDADNNVKYFLHPNDFRFKENGEIANIYGYTVDTPITINQKDYTILASDFGNVSIRFKKSYYAHRYVAGKHTWKLSAYQFTGSEVHPAFKRYRAADGEVVEVDYAYIGRYEGVLFDASENRCQNGVYIDQDITAVASTKVITFANPEQYLEIGDKIKETSAVLGAANAVYTITDITRNADMQTLTITVAEAINDVTVATAITLRNDIDFANDKLMSVSGKKPLTYISQTEARQLSGNNGVQYSQQVYADWFLVQLLAAVKYSTLNIQTALGAGKTASSGEYKYVSVTGLSDSIGMADFCDNTNNKQFLGGSSIFGLENTYGNIWKCMDGLKCDDWVLSLSVDNSQFDVSGSYENTGIELPHENGYWSKLQNTNKGIFPAIQEGDSVNDIGDYYYQASGARVGHVGGLLSNGALAGLSYLVVSASASYRDWHVGARVRS